MNLNVLLTLIYKDTALFFRNRFFALITVLSLVIYVAIYLLMPSEAEERFDVALYPADVSQAVQAEFTSREMTVTLFDDEQAMRDAVEAGDYRVGVVVPAGAVQSLSAGEATNIIAYYPPGIPENLNRAFNDLLTMAFNGLSYTLDDQPLLINRNEEVLGYDLAGEALAVRDRLLPVLAMLLFLTETLGLANLIAQEIERGTLRALLITPMSVLDLFVGKSITGIVIGFAQAALLLLVTGALGYEPLLVLTALLLGALLITGLGFLIASVSSDMMSVMSWGMLAMLIFGLPAVSILFPGTISDWVRIIPSYYLLDALHRVINFGASWQDVTAHLLILLLSGTALLVLGTTVLRRKLA